MTRFLASAAALTLVAAPAMAATHAKQAKTTMVKTKHVKADKPAKAKKAG